MTADMPLMEEKLTGIGLRKISDHRKDDWVQITLKV
jgi:hypothetical protein